jgi:hypothetical protein
LCLVAGIKRYNKVNTEWSKFAMGMKLNRSAFLNFNSARGTPKMNPFDDYDQEPRRGQPPPPPKRPMAVYCIVGVCAAMLQVAIIASAALLLFGNINAPASPESQIISGTKAILASNAKYVVADADLREGKIEIKDLTSGKIASFSAADIKNGSFKFANGGGEEVSVEPRKAETIAANKPANIPDGMTNYLYPGVPHRVISYAKSEGQEDGDIEQFTDDPIPKVFATFEKNLLAEGYSITSKTLYEDSGSIVFGLERPSRVIAIDAVHEEGRTKIAIQYNFNAR